MAEVMLNGQQIPLDKHGYLADLSLWSHALAEYFANEEGIELTEAHWEVLHFVRDFYQEHQTSPAIRLLVKAMAQHYGPEKGSSKYLFMLFPDGPAKQATRIAGLPKPARCL
ncbi:MULTISPECIES: TusE/DsrC/DsvC family sulfur relay protein [Alkalimonas]|uniref:Sulfurtransferase n=1 Tax=Alkalimonas mucilaginosa TaxID=3057676 RepID=A0ABU7JHR7_9GAMM|nr:TusE/DsrC/DsvC family sulfur relay protein [Alkalimonas sp. MEB004]MEE2025243.1 TusE/DsrC/DsvC family sulfur relay protein [Alkalimonas sp. MEB004]